MTLPRPEIVLTIARKFWGYTMRPFSFGAVCGFILVIIPGIIWMLATSVAVPAYIDKPGLGVSDAVSKSFEMTRGVRWVLLAIFIVFTLTMIAIGACGGMVWVVAEVSFTRMGNPAIGGLPLLDVGQAFTTAFTRATEVLGVAMVTAKYLALRDGRGKPSELTAEVFS